MRIDFATDVPLPVNWFRETVRVEHKRFRAAVTGQPFYSEMGKGKIQTLYFGKRPNLIRIYDKLAEYQEQYRILVRKLGKDVEPPSFESEFGVADSILTRVERQIGGRIPPEIQTLRHVVESGSNFRPFAKLRIIDHPRSPELDAKLSFEKRCTGLYLQGMRRNDGMQATNAFISKYSKGNPGWVRKKYGSFLSGDADGTGLTEADLQRLFQESLSRQMSP
jgi:hypothetical protein